METDYKEGMMCDHARIERTEDHSKIGCLRCKKTWKYNPIGYYSDSFIGVFTKK